MYVLNMKALVQRVLNGKVTVDGEVISSIEQGICVFIGISKNDTKKDMEYIVHKLLHVKLFDDESGNRWKKTVVDKQFEILSLSQFTLYNTWKGTKPDFHNAMPGEKSKEFYDNFLEMLREAYVPEKIKIGIFGKHIQVHIQNDGPVTFQIESPATLNDKEKKRNNESKEDNDNN